MVDSIQQDEGSFHQHFGRIFKEDISKVLHLEHSFYGAESLTL
jgi:hypothetical protein